MEAVPEEEHEHGNPQEMDDSLFLMAIFSVNNTLTIQKQSIMMTFWKFN